MNIRLSVPMGTRAESAERFAVAGSSSENTVVHAYVIVSFASSPDCCREGERFGDHLHMCPEPYFPDHDTFAGTVRVSIGDRITVEGTEYVLTENEHPESPDEPFGDPVLIPA